MKKKKCTEITETNKKLVSRNFNEEDVANILKVSRKTLQAWRGQGKGPRFLKIGRSIRYSEDSLADFMSLAERRSTSEYDS